MSLRGFSEDSDSGRNYQSGAWGGGDLNAEALADKYNLDRSNEARGAGHIWGRNADGTDVYIGKSSMDLAGNSDLISNHSSQASGNEIDHSGIPESLSSLGDIKGAILTEWAGGAAPEEAGSDEPIEYMRPAYQDAKERVQKFEEYRADPSLSPFAVPGTENPIPNFFDTAGTENKVLDFYNTGLDLTSNVKDPMKKQMV